MKIPWSQLKGLAIKYLVPFLAKKIEKKIHPQPQDSK